VDQIVVAATSLLLCVGWQSREVAVTFGGVLLTC
jgi:hypothetical protein